MFKTIKTYRDLHAAEVDKGLLESHGLQVVLENAGLVGANPLLSNAVGEVQLKVSADDAEKALELLS